MHKLGMAFYAVLLWLIGFVWGSIVFMTPALKQTAAVPYVSANPFISFPILIIWVPLSYLLAKKYLKNAVDKKAEGLRLGLFFSVVNILLDVIVLVVLLRAGASYFVSLTVWAGYALLLIIPWLAGHRMQRMKSA